MPLACSYQAQQIIFVETKVSSCIHLVIPQLGFNVIEQWFLLHIFDGLGELQRFGWGAGYSCDI